MEWKFVQLVEVALFLGVAVPVRILFVRIRRGLLAEAGSAGGRGRAVVTAADAVTWLLYLAYALGVFPFELPVPGDPGYYDAAFDAAAVFTLLVAAVEVTSLLTVHRAAQHLEQWPPRPT
ncbi:MAG TPA: hypothetical protein VG318_09315 [Actinomycetota bacterium]|nr:hypothetical protein [Actinomycetota bacterium]